MDDFLAAPGGVLIGTDMALLYLSDIVEHIAVVSLDSLFSVPDYRIAERIMTTLTTMRLSASKSFAVQTRHADQPVLRYGVNGNLIDFYRDEIEMRKQLFYPPYSVLIKITRRGKQHTVERDMRALAAQLEGENVSLYPSAPKGNSFVMNALLRISRDQWVDDELLEWLRALPPQFIVDVDPAQIL